MKLHLRKPRSKAELEHCIRLYKAVIDESFTPVSLERLLLTVPRISVLRIAVDNSGEIVAFIAAQDIQHTHIPSRVLQQQYYFSIYKGFKAVRALQIMHSELVREAEIRGIPIVLAQCSHVDTSFQLSRALELAGWDRCGYLAVRKTKWFQTPSEDREGIYNGKKQNIVRVERPVIG